MNPNDILTAKAKVLHSARSILQGATKELRAMNTEEKAAYEKAMADHVALGESLKLLGDLANKEKEGEAEAEAVEAASRGRISPTADGESRSPHWTDSKEYRSAYLHYLATGEKRNHSAGNFAAGGSFVAPQKLVSEILTVVGKEVFVRNFAKVWSDPTVDSFGAPSINSRPVATWVGERQVAPAGTISTGKRELKPQAMSAQVTISRKLARIAPVFERELTNLLSEAFGEAEEEKFLMGDGVERPLGVFTLSDHGITASRDYAMGAAITMDKIVAARWSLHSKYRKNSIWVFNPVTAAYIATLKTEGSTGHYYWQPAKALGEPDTLCGIPVYTSEYAPNTLTGSGNYVGVLGDFSEYIIGESLSFELDRLVETYSQTNDIGLVARREVDGMPGQQEAFLRLKISA